MGPRPESTDWQSLARTLADGFQSLLKETEYLSKREQELDARLEYAFKEYIKLASDPILDNHNSKQHEEVARAIREVDYPGRAASEGSMLLNLPKQLDDVDEIRNGFEAYKTVKVKLQELRKPVGRCPFPGTRVRSGLEQDFTTPGKVGNLECPFAQMAKRNNGIPTPPQNLVGNDPIAAEFHPELISQSSVAAPPSTTGTATKCPIRYLDQHSPEEVAKYFENHKHEIPRSHEICVKRYQKNSDSIRELDSKYGNLVSMIQGLGVKHQQYLPHKDGEHNVDGGPSSSGAVQKWADEVSLRTGQSKQEMQSAPDVAVDDERIGHFQRPLREIRVGESPSRPWGITVPVALDEAPSPPHPIGSAAAHLQEPPTAGPADPEQKREKSMPAKCPFDHKAMKPPAQKIKHDADALPTSQSQRSQSSQPVMVFNGPVFFGYPADQAAATIKSMSNEVTNFP